MAKIHKYDNKQGRLGKNSNEKGGKAIKDLQLLKYSLFYLKEIIQSRYTYQDEIDI